MSAAGVTPPDGMARPATAPREELDIAAYARLFEGHPDGQKVLDDLYRRFCQPAVTSGGIDAVIKTYHRAGARAVVEYILARVNQANGVDEQIDNDN